MPRGDSYFLQGQQGGVVVNYAGIIEGPFRVVLVIEDADIEIYEDDTQLFSSVMKAGASVQLPISRFVLNSGTVIAYYA